jgi:hypothetical protein
MAIALTLILSHRERKYFPFSPWEKVRMRSAKAKQVNP